MAGKEPSTGPTSRAVAQNVRRWREARNMSYTQLSDKLQTDAGWSINPVGIRRIEDGERRVTPDDLMALAVALVVSPTRLLMPGLPDADPTEMVEVTGMDAKVQLGRLWMWLKGEPSSLVSGNELSFFEDSVPHWERGRWMKDAPHGR